METTHPWQITPTELIKQAIEFLHRDSDTNRQIAFLLLDVGIETLFKTFLLLPESVTGVNSNYHKRKEATGDVNFHTLVETIKEFGKGRLSGIDLEKVKYYHDIRNKLYHQGDGVIPTNANTQDYASIAAELLYRLLSVDLRPLLLEEQQKTEMKERRKVLVEEILEPLKQLLREHIRICHTYLVRQLEDEESEFAKKSFVDDMEEYINRLSQPDGERWKSGIRRFINEGLFMLDDDGMPVECYKWDPMEDMGVVEFIMHMMAEKSPAGRYPKELDDLMNESELPYTEYELAEILTADDFAEVLILVTNIMHDFTHKISIEDYREAKRILTWDFEKAMSDEDFENRLSEIVERAKQLLNKDWFYDDYESGVWVTTEE